MNHVYIHVPKSNYSLGGRGMADAGFTKFKVYSLITFAVIAVILWLILLLGSSLQDSWKKSNFYNILYLNLITSSLICTCVARPMTVLQGVTSYIPSPSYCTTYVFILEIETVTIPLAVLMLTIERVVYFRSLSPMPVSERKRLSWCHCVLMVGLPWMIGITLALIKTFGLLNPIDVPDYKSDVHRTPTSYITSDDVPTMTNVTSSMVHGNGKPEIAQSQDGLSHFSCHMTERNSLTHIIEQVILYTFKSSFPVIYLTVSWVLMLVAWWEAYYILNPEQQVAHYEDGALRRTNEPSMPGPQEPTIGISFQEGLQEVRAKTYATVWVGSLLIVWCMCVSVTGSIRCKDFGWLVEDTQWFYFSLEFAAIISACIFFPDVRDILFCKKRLCKNQAGNPQCNTRQVRSCQSSAESIYSLDTMIRNNNTDKTDGPTPCTQKCPAITCTKL